MERCFADSRSEQELWDRLTLLLISYPKSEWQDVFSEIVRREIERLMPSPEAQGDD